MPAGEEVRPLKADRGQGQDGRTSVIRWRTGKGPPPAAPGDLHVGHHMSTTRAFACTYCPRASSAGEPRLWWAGGLWLWSSPQTCSLKEDSGRHIESEDLPGPLHHAVRRDSSHPAPWPKPWKCWWKSRWKRTLLPSLNKHSKGHLASLS